MLRSALDRRVNRRTRHRFDLARGVELHDLGDALGMAAALELRGQEHADDLAVDFRVHKATGQADHVAVVVATEEVGELRRGDGAGAHAGNLVGGDGDADARAAHAHATVGVAGDLR